MEKINIIDILRGCPEGTKLYSLVHGYMELIDINRGFIRCKPNYLDIIINFHSDGRWVENRGECILFPSKENRNWSTFKRPFKDGDIIYNPGIKATAIFYKQTNDHTISHCFLNILGELKINHYHSKSLLDWRLASEEEKQELFKVIKDNGYCWNPKTKTLDPKFKDGDVVFYSNTIAIFKEWGDETLFRTYCTFYTTVSNPTYQFEISRPLNGKGIRKEARFATLEEKEKLFEAIRDNGYGWDPETKTLKKLPKFKVGNKIKLKGGDQFGIITQVSDCFYTINCKNHTHYWSIAKQDDWELVPNKFNISTLVPFESRVLVRDVDNYEWEGAIFGRYDGKKFFTIGGMDWRCCIPYEGNEHLLGKTIDCEEFYKNWR